MSRPRDPHGIGFDPDILRTLHDAYGRMLAAAEAIRVDMATLPELLALASIVDELEEKRSAAAKRLRGIEERRHRQARQAVEVSA